MIFKTWKTKNGKKRKKKNSSVFIENSGNAAFDWDPAPFLFEAPPPLGDKYRKNLDVFLFQSCFSWTKLTIFFLFDYFSVCFFSLFQIEWSFVLFCFGRCRVSEELNLCLVDMCFFRFFFVPFFLCSVSPRRKRRRRRRRKNKSSCKEWRGERIGFSCLFVGFFFEWLLLWLFFTFSCVFLF